MKNLSKIEIEDLIIGATILGVGGGGSPDDGLRSLIEQYDRGKKLTIASLDEFDQGDRIASPYFVGSVAPSQPKKNITKVVDDPIARAFKLLEKRVSQKIAGTIATEIGGGNTAASLAIAAKLGIPMVDGDLMGRAGPELHQSTVHIFSFSMAPSAIVSETGNEFVVERYAAIDDYEALARYASVISGGHVAVADCPLLVSDAKRCVIQGTITQCIGIGRARRESNELGKDPVEAVAGKLSNGKRIFEGRVSEYSWKDEKGFLLGEAHLSGTGKYEGKKLRSWIMNEHIMCWIDDKPAVMPPDLIMFLDPTTGLGITSDKLKKSMQVVVAGSSINKMWRNEKGLALFGPKHFGFEYDYVPFERISSNP
jgi:uncharacterized protein